MQTPHTRVYRFPAAVLVVLAAALTACGPGVDQPASGIDFGETYSNGNAVEQRIALTNNGGRAETVTEISWATGTAFTLADPALPIVLDSGPAYGFTFAFQPPNEGYQQWDDVATLTIESGNTSYQVNISMTGIFTNGDLDGDGHVDEQYGCPDCDDCNDADATIFPGNEEICDGKDNNCDGNTGALEVDADGDNFLICEGDCNDNSVAQNPSVNEMCDDGVDNDCDGSPGADEIDTDNDGYTGCDGDCEEGEPSVNPGATEVCDGFDTDCSNNGVVPDDEADADVDGWFLCSGDCDDANNQANPGQTEACDGFDTDCDPSTTTAESELDVDGDGVFVCNGDCDDGQPLSFPGNPEVCDFIDNDCDGVIPADEVDGDGDLSPDCVDCDDGNASVYPGAPDICDGVDDNDCDSVTDPQEVDDDSDTYTDCDGDCDDADPNTNPGATEICDGIDNDCSGDPLALETFDSDGDGILDCDDTDCPFWVDDDASGGSPDGSPSNPFATVADGIAAVETDPACPTVAVAPGTYNGTVDFGSLDLRLVSSEGPVLTILDGSGTDEPVVVIDDGQTNAAVLQGFTVTNGSSVFTNDYSGHGGGIYVEASPTIQDNIIIGNEAAFHGGGLYSEGGDVVLLNNTFSDNLADFDGGGAYLKDTDALIEGNQFLDNEADDDAGGLFLGVGSLPEVRWNVFAENECSGVNNPGGTVGWGGALVLHTNTDADVHNNLFVGNVASTEGGAVYVHSSSPTFTNNSLFDNHVTAPGASAGLRVFSGEVSNNVFAGGTGVGIRVAGSGSTLTFTYNDVWDFTGGAYFDDPAVSGDGSYTGTDGNIEVDPLFVTSTEDFVWNDDLTLQTGSLLIDAGDPNVLLNDVDGSTNDIGAFGGPDGDWTP